jgi:hypothetical protein
MRKLFAVGVAMLAWFVAGAGVARGQTVLPRSGWVATASTTNSGEPASRAVDGNGSTRWSTGASQTAGQWFSVDMGAPQTFSQVTIDPTSSSDDWTRAYQVFVSNDAITWGSPVASGTGAPGVLTIVFPTQTARFVGIVQTGSGSNWWSIGELNVYGPGATPTVALNPAGWVASASVTGGSDVPSHAIDGTLSTRWSTGTPQVNGQSFQVDMLQTQTIAKVTMATDGSSSDFPRAFQIFVGDNPASFGPAVASGTGSSAVVTVSFPPSAGRFLKIVQTGSASNWWSIAELTVFAVGSFAPTPVVLSRAGWTATASPSCSSDVPANALDDNASTRFSTCQNQANGQFFQVDMQAPRAFTKLTLDAGTSSGDYPRGYQIFASNDPANFGSPIASGAGTGQLVTITFPYQTARYLKVVQTGSASSNWWSIHELNVYGAAPYLLLRNGWVASASTNTSAASTAIDGRLSTRWTTNVSQTNGQWFQLDMRAPQTFNQLTLNADGASGDFPRGYQVAVSNDGTTFGAPVVTGVGSSSLVAINFPAQTARYVRVTQTGAASNWWSISEINVLAPALVPFVQCSSPLGAGKFTALFGYDSGAGADVVIPLGAQNQVVPTPSGGTPPTVFHAGHQTGAFLAASSSSAPMTWTLQGTSVIASPGLPRVCVDADYPAPPDPHPGLVDPTSSSPPSATALASYLQSLSTPPITPPPLPGKIFGPTTPPPPFVFRITETHQKDDAFFSPSMQVNVSIDGTGIASPNLGPCPDSVTNGCISQPGGFGAPQAVDVSFTKVIPHDQPTVTVRVEVVAVSHTPDDTENVITLTIDPRTGTFTGTSNAGPLASPTHCSDANGWGICWEIGTLDPPPLTGNVALCATLGASFIDSGYGEDIGNAMGAAQFPARFMNASIVLPSGDEFPVGASAGAFLALDANGCTPAVFPASALATPLIGGTRTITGTLKSQLVNGGVTWNVLSTTPDTRNVVPSSGGGCQFILRTRNRSTTNFTASASQVAGDFANWSRVGGWLVPPAQVTIADRGVALQPGNGENVDVARVSVVVGQMMNTTDNGMVDGMYNANADDGCPTNDTGILGDSCETANELFIGPGRGCPQDGRPSQSAWKYIIAHESGHLIQARAMGLPAGGGDMYQFKGADGLIHNDPDGTPDLCRCDHVFSANAEHCLQSLERSGTSQIEGYAQFYASKTWNAPASPTCRFNYYKEFLADQCLPGTKECTPFNTHTNNLPPVPVGCKNPVKWRNDHCASNPDFGIEFDWMGFYFNLNTVGPSRLLLPTLYQVYEQACGGHACEEFVGWQGCTDPTTCDLVEGSLRDAAQTVLGATSTQFANFSTLGDAFGVSRDTTP